MAKELDLELTNDHEIVFDSHEQMEGSCTDGKRSWPAYSLTTNPGQSFLTHRFGRESILSPLEP
jgi:hypothetical protein